MNKGVLQCQGQRYFCCWYFTKTLSNSRKAETNWQQLLAENHLGSLAVSMRQLSTLCISHGAMGILNSFAAQITSYQKCSSDDRRAVEYWNEFLSALLTRMKDKLTVPFHQYTVFCIHLALYIFNWLSPISIIQFQSPKQRQLHLVSISGDWVNCISISFLNWLISKNIAFIFPAGNHSFM